MWIKIRSAHPDNKGSVEFVDVEVKGYQGKMNIDRVPTDAILELIWNKKIDFSGSEANAAVQRKGQLASISPTAGKLFAQLIKK